MMAMIHRTFESDEPDMMLLFLQGVLLRAGGQQRFTLVELLNISQEYQGVRITDDKNDESVTLTLLSRRAGVDPG